MDKILISQIDCVAAIGVTREEQTMRQRLSIDIELSVDTRPAARTDSLKDALDYSKVAGVVKEVCLARTFHLIETVAEQLADRLLSDFQIPELRVLVRKISPVLDPRVSHVSVEITRFRVEGRNSL